VIADVDWSQGLPAAAMAGAAVGLFSLIPVIGLGCCLWMMLGGGISVALYSRRKIAAQISAGMGARLGAVTGLFGFVMYALGAALELLLLRGPNLRNALRQAVEQSASRNPDPRAQEILQRFTSPEGMALLITLTMMMFLLAFIIFGSVGGALWASLGPRQRR
jgi:hypothetical protein